jgi:hypothetical protein
MTHTHSQTNATLETKDTTPEPDLTAVDQQQPVSPLSQTNETSDASRCGAAYHSSRVKC